MDGVKHTMDLAGAGAALLSVVHALPDVLAAVASAMTIIWYSIRLVEWYQRKGRE
jgi:hypothetical protein